MARTYVITLPVVDLRSRPVEIPRADFSHQDERESQLLFREPVELLEERGEWVKIGALEQPCFNEAKGWHPYPGWVLRKEIEEVGSFSNYKTVVCEHFTSINGTLFPYGTLLEEDLPESLAVRKIPKTLCRTTLVSEAKRFLGAPYLWGGRSFPLKNSICSVDCSGLINLLYRAQGIIIPRNAHDQYLKSQPISSLLPGDPLFLAKEKRVSHVLLKLDDTTFLESPETGKNIRTLTWGEHIWEKEGKIHIFDRPSPYSAFPRTFF